MYPWVNLNLREENKIGAKTIIVIPKKAQVKVIEEIGEWSKVSYDNKVGYVYNYYLSADGENPNKTDLDLFYKNMLLFVNNNNIQSSTNYLVITNLKSKYTYIFKKDNNRWIQVYMWLCTIGKSKTPTITGEYLVNGRKIGFGTDEYYVKYATRINGAYYYHSILYNKTGAYAIDSRLGLALSHGCIRLATKNAQWIYDNIPDETKVIIH